MWRTAVDQAAIEYSDGKLLAEFIANYCTLTTDTIAGRIGEPLVLRDWQHQLLNELFARDPKTQKRLFRRAYIGLPRKNGKSALGACIGLNELFLGAGGAEIYSVAASRDQARIVFKMAKTMVNAHPELARTAKVYQNLIEVPSTGAIYRVLSSDAPTAEGLNPNLVIFDEVHAQPNRELWDTMSLGSGARTEPLMLGITTAGVRTDASGRDSLGYSLYQHGRRCVAGEIDDPSFYFCWWEPSNPECDHLDPKVWQESNPGYGDLNTPEDFEAQSKTTLEPEFRTKRLNQWVNTAHSWLPNGAWAGCGDASVVVPDGTHITIGFDGSFSNDSTGLVGCTLDGHIFVIDSWERPPQADEHWRVNVIEVENALRAACERYKVVEIVADPFLWRDVLEVLAADGLPVVEYNNTPGRMVAATQRFYEAVTQRQLTHDGDSRLSRHIDNTVIKFDRQGPRISKESKASQRKIDLCVCAVMAFDRAMQVEPVQQPNWFIY